MTKDTGIFALCGYCVRCITASEVKAAFVDVPPNPMFSVLLQYIPDVHESDSNYMTGGSFYIKSH